MDYNEICGWMETESKFTGMDRDKDKCFSKLIV